jgi:hypothetical protein
MKDGLADGLTRVRARVAALRGRGGGSGDRYELLPSGAGRNRRLAELGAVAGVVVVVVAFVGAAIALRPSAAPSGPSGPGLPAPTEFSVQQSLSPSPSGTSVTFVPPGPTGSDPTGRGRPLPSSTFSAGPTGAPTSAAPTTRASATVPPKTKPPVVTPPPSPASPSVTPTPTPTPTVEPTTDPPPVGLP